MANPPTNSSVSDSLLFKGLSPSEISTALGAARRKVLKKGQVLFRQGEPSQATFIVRSGRIKLFQSDLSGRQTLLRILGPGEILAITATVGAPDYPATAVAERETEVLFWAGKRLEGLIREIPQLGINALGIVSKRMREMQSRFGELAAERVERRLARTLLRLGSQHGKRGPRGTLVDVEMSRQELAEMAGSTVFSMSRILSAWEKRSILESKRKGILILDPSALASIAEERE
jgi:CRP-like cAMP-binding protein